MFTHINKRVLTAAVIVAGGLPSAAAATPLYDPPGSSVTAALPTVQTATPRAVAQPEQGFRWDDAGLGAAGMLVLVGVGSGAAVAMRDRSGRAVMG
jgi:hypothetical protein